MALRIIDSVIAGYRRLLAEIWAGDMVPVPVTIPVSDNDDPSITSGRRP